MARHDFADQRAQVTERLGRNRTRVGSPVTDRQRDDRLRRVAGAHQHDREARHRRRLAQAAQPEQTQDPRAEIVTLAQRG